MNNRYVFQAIEKGDFKRDVIYSALLFKGKAREQLFKMARRKLMDFFPSKKVEIRSVIEISNICQRNCYFCNINRYSKMIKRYIIDFDDLIKIVEIIYHKNNRRVILLQSGENRSQNYIDFICRFVVTIKHRFNDLKIILCLGSLSRSQYRQLWETGAERYILKFETSNPKLYKQIKPDDSLRKRVDCIKMLCELGFEVGTGNIIGLPGQTIDDIIDDLFFIRNFSLTMGSASVFIPGEESKYHNKKIGDLKITLNYMALMRILYPQLLIPSTSSLEKAKRGGQYLGLLTGANAVTVHDGTPIELKSHFPIYSVNRFTPDEKYIKNIVKKANLHL